jgi:hypothetical protein
MTNALNTQRGLDLMEVFENLTAGLEGISGNFDCIRFGRGLSGKE